MVGSECSDAAQQKQVDKCLLQPVSSHVAYSTYHFSLAHISSYKRSNLLFVPNRRWPFEGKSCRLYGIGAELRVSLPLQRLTLESATYLTIRTKFQAKTRILDIATPAHYALDVLTRK
jgi:hypothetical protein